METNKQKIFLRKLSIVAIAAAIAMAESESSDVKFKVVSFRRK